MSHSPALLQAYSEALTKLPPISLWTARGARLSAPDYTLPDGYLEVPQRFEERTETPAAPAARLLRLLVAARPQSAPAGTRTLSPEVGRAAFLAAARTVLDREDASASEFLMTIAGDLHLDLEDWAHLVRHAEAELCEIAAASI